MLQSRCQRKVNGTVVVWVWRVTENLVLKSLIKFYSDGWDLREHPQRRARQAVASGNFNSEKIISEWAQHGDPKFEAKKFIKKAMQEVAEKLKNWSGAAVKRKLLKNNEDWNNFLRSMIRNHELFFYDLTYWAVMTDLRSSSSSHYLEFNRKAQPRNWNAAKYMW